jgi:hypothetical protein
VSRIAAGVLTCSECGRQSDENAIGWQAHLGADDIEEVPEDEEPKRVLAFSFCPECAKREFGERVMPPYD